jgi:hypothetical protein
MGRGANVRTKGQPFSGSGHRCRDSPRLLPTVEIANYSAGRIAACPGAGEAIGQLVSLLAPGLTSQAIRIFRKPAVRNDQDAMRDGQLFLRGRIFQLR